MYLCFLTEGMFVCCLYFSFNQGLNKPVSFLLIMQAFIPEYLFFRISVAPPDPPTFIYISRGLTKFTCFYFFSLLSQDEPFPPLPLCFSLLITPLVQSRYGESDGHPSQHGITKDAQVISFILYFYQLFFVEAFE